MRIQKFLLSVCSLIALHASCQESYYFTKGLATNIPTRYGREAIYTDELAYKLYTKTLKTPAEGDTISKNENGEAYVWFQVVADSANRLIARRPGMRGGFRGGGYIYLTYSSNKERPALLNIMGNNSVIFNGEPHAGDPYRLGYMHIPVKLKKGLNEFYVRGSFITASLTFLSKPIILKSDDATLPSVVITAGNKNLQGAIVVINTSSQELKGLQIKSSLSQQAAISNLPAIPAMSMRKVPFVIDGSSVHARGKQNCQIVLLKNGVVLDESTVPLEAVDTTEKYSNTFISSIDGSLQYYAVAPQLSKSKHQGALFLSVHGAAVEAIGQARAYQSKDWGTLVAATNRRPRGFNWEDWGRIDALEVLNLAKLKFNPDPKRIYLTGHSMGGHGTWFLGATYPDKWAAIAPCAGYPTLKSYGSADGLIPDSSNSPVERMLLRSSNQSDVIKLANNYKSQGVYIFHGDSDRVVSVEYARQMKKILADFHSDISYYEYPGGSHWFGNHSVDWKPLFDFFAWHKLPEDTLANTIDFTTASPGISPSMHWASIYQQVHPLQYSRIQLKRDINRKSITGTTANVSLLKLDLKNFVTGSLLAITLDGTETLRYTIQSATDSLFLRHHNGKWSLTTSIDAVKKGPHRYGTLKDAFNHNMIFVYGTIGTREENEWSFSKARYDAETWYYRGNGAVDIVADKDYSTVKYKDRGVILYGNKSTNKAWNTLLNDCPIQVDRNKITAGDKVWSGPDLGAYFIWPIANSPVASVATITGTGLTGMKTADANQYFAGGSGFPDFMIFRLSMLQSGTGGVEMAGFFDMDWKISNEDIIEAKR